MEEKAAVDSGVCVVAEEAGVVERSTSAEIQIRQDDGKLKKYKQVTVATPAAIMDFAR